MTAPAYCRCCGVEVDPICLDCRATLERSRDAIRRYHEGREIVIHRTHDGASATDHTRLHEMAEEWPSTVRARIERSV
jgi:hypothetical protein